MANKITYKTIKVVDSVSGRIKKKKATKGSRLTKYEKIYLSAQQNSAEIIKNGKILNLDTAAARASYVYESRPFADLIKAGRQIRSHERNSIFGFVSISLVYCLLSILMMFMKSVPEIPITAPVVILIFGIVFYPQVSYKDFYACIYLPVCFYCAGAYDKKDDTYVSPLKDCKNIKGRHIGKTDKMLVANARTITKIQRVVKAENLVNFRFEKGKFTEVREPTTIFSGFSFDTTYRGIHDDCTEMLYAVVHKDTFNRVSAIAKDKEEFFEITELFSDNSDWLLYRNKTAPALSKREKRSIREKTLSMYEELGPFNVYVYNTRIKIFYGLTYNREGLEASSFRASVKNDSLLSYFSFMSIVKILYIIKFNEVFIKMFLNDKQITTQFSSRRQIFNKRGSAYISTLITVMITIIIGAFIYNGISVICDRYINGNADMHGDIYTEFEQSDAVKPFYDYIE